MGGAAVVMEIPMDVDSYTVVQGIHVTDALLLVVMNGTCCAPRISALSQRGVVCFGMELVELSGRSSIEADRIGPPTLLEGGGCGGRIEVQLIERWGTAST